MILDLLVRGVPAIMVWDHASLSGRGVSRLTSDEPRLEIDDHETCVVWFVVNARRKRSERATIVWCLEPPEGLIELLDRLRFGAQCRDDMIGGSTVTCPVDASIPIADHQAYFTHGYLSILRASARCSRHTCILPSVSQSTARSTYVFTLRMQCQWAPCQTP